MCMGVVTFILANPMKSYWMFRIAHIAMALACFAAKLSEVISVVTRGTT